MKVDNDFKERIKIGCLFIFQSYKVLTGSLLLMFVPQECNNELCSITEPFNSSNIISNIALSFNMFSIFSFLILYLVELKREHHCVKRFDIDHSVSDNVNLPEEYTERVEMYNKYYSSTVIGTSIVYLINIVFSSIIIFKNYAGPQTLSAYISYLILIIMKLYNCYYIASMGDLRILSSYMTEFSSFNVMDNDYVQRKITSNVHIESNKSNQSEQIENTEQTNTEQTNAEQSNNNNGKKNKPPPEPIMSDITIAVLN